MTVHVVTAIIPLTHNYEASNVKSFHILGVMYNTVAI